MFLEPLIIKNVPVEKVVEIARFAQRGLEHPRVVGFSRGDDFLNKLSDNYYSADFFGCALVGKFGDPETARAKFSEAECEMDIIFGLSSQQMDQIFLTIGSSNLDPAALVECLGVPQSHFAA